MNRKNSDSDAKQYGERYDYINDKYIEWINTDSSTPPQPKISELLSNHRRERFQKRRTKCAFAFQEKLTYQFDCYHISSQYKEIENMNNESLLELVNQNIFLLERLLSQDHNHQNIFVCAQFANKSFVDAVKLQGYDAKKKTEHSALISKALKNKQTKLNKFLAISNNLNEMLKTQMLSQSTICKSLRISRNFFKFSFNLLENPTIVQQFNTLFKEAVTTAEIGNNRFIEFFKTFHTKYKTKQELR